MALEAMAVATGVAMEIHQEAEASHPGGEITISPSLRRPYTRPSKWLRGSGVTTPSIFFSRALDYCRFASSKSQLSLQHWLYFAYYAIRVTRDLGQETVTSETSNTAYDRKR